MRLSALRDLLARRRRPQAVAITRIGVGIAVILKALERLPVLERLADPGVISVPYVPGQPTLAGLAPAAIAVVWLLLGTLFTVGAATSLAGTLLTGLLAAVLFSDQQLYSNHLYLLVWLVGLLTLAGAGSALSIDARWRGARDHVAAWPIVLIQLQIVVVYLYAGLSKINLEYLSGSVVAVSLRETGPLALPASWQSFEPMAVASILSIVTELGLGVGLLVRRWRRTAFVVGLGLHLAIAVWLLPTGPLVIFGIMMLSAYVLFVPTDNRLTVVWDDSCGFCGRWVDWFRRLDWLRIVDFVPSSDAAGLSRHDVPRDDADRALQLVRDGRRTQGFDAVIGVLEHLPASFLWAPMLRLWPILTVGRRSYARVAASRRCSINPAGGRKDT